MDWLFVLRAITKGSNSRILRNNDFLSAITHHSIQFFWIFNTLLSITFENENWIRFSTKTRQEIATQNELSHQWSERKRDNEWKKAGNRAFAVRIAANWMEILARDISTWKWKSLAILSVIWLVGKQ
jgi:hypothetical protein